MKKLNKLIIFFVTITTVVRAYDPILEDQRRTNSAIAAEISPEIINELKDFKNLISTTTIDEIVAKHYMFDKNFRTAFNYLRSQEFSKLQKQLLNLPEIIDILKFLHLTTTNATTRHMGATKMTTAKVKVSLDEYNDVVAVNNNDDNDDDDDDDDNNDADNTGTIISQLHATTIENAKGTLNNKKDHKRPQKLQTFEEEEEDEELSKIYGDEYAYSVATTANELLPSVVHITLLEDAKINAKFPNMDFQQNFHQYLKYKRNTRNSNTNYHLHRHYYHYKKHTLPGTFAGFVEEVLQNLPHTAFQNMIIEKCRRNANFAEFYKAIRSPEFRPLIDETKLTANIKKIIQTLNSHDVDVEYLESIAFKLIASGPNI